MTTKGLTTYCSKKVIVNGQDLCWDCANRRITALVAMGQKVTILYMGIQIVLKVKETGKTIPSFIGTN